MRRNHRRIDRSHHLRQRGVELHRLGRELKRLGWLGLECQLDPESESRDELTELACESHVGDVNEYKRYKGVEGC